MALYLVTQSKRGKINQLAYDQKTGEYVYIHRGVEQWREKGDTSLFDYFNYLRATGEFCDGESMQEMSTFHIYEKYCQCCLDFQKTEWVEPTRKIVGII